MFRRSTPVIDEPVIREVLPDDRVVLDGRPLPPPAYGTVVERPVVTARPPVEHDVESVFTSQRFSVASVLAALAGVALVAIGLIALLRGGLGGPIDEPVVDVLGVTHTPLLGVIDVVMGVLLLAVAAGASRGGLVFLGLLGVIAGAVALAEPAELQESLAVERPFAWAWLLGGALIALAAWILPVYDRQVSRTRRGVV